MPVMLRDWQEPEKSGVLSSFHKGLRDRDLNMVVVTRLCRATLSCDGELINRYLRPGSVRAAKLGAVYSSITLIDSSSLIFRPSSTKCNVGAMSRAPMHGCQRPSLLAWSPSVALSIVAVSRHRQAHRPLKWCATAKSLGVTG